MHWLRAKAQFERWQEEHDSIHNEAVWIPAFFQAKVECWKNWMNITAEEKLPGSAAFASRQVHLWEEMWRSSKKALIPITSVTSKKS